MLRTFSPRLMDRSTLVNGVHFLLICADYIWVVNCNCNGEEPWYKWLPAIATHQTRDVGPALVYCLPNVSCLLEYAQPMLFFSSLSAQDRV